MKAVRLIGISGSVRKSSANTGLLRFAQAQVADGVMMDLLDIRGLPLHERARCWRDSPDDVRDAVRRLRSADGLVLAVPLDGGGLPPAMENFLGWLHKAGASEPLKDKPVALMGASTCAPGDAALSGLRQRCVSLGMLPLRRHEVFVNAFDRGFDVYGEVRDEGLQGDVAALIRRLAESIRGAQPRAGVGTQRPAFMAFRPLALQG
jgi:chromate reductase